jgi:hypothetical protein
MQTEVTYSRRQKHVTQVAMEYKGKSRRWNVNHDFWIVIQSLGWTSAIISLFLYYETI